jgi:hypothetical protein
MAVVATVEIHTMEEVEGEGLEEIIEVDLES